MKSTVVFRFAFALTAATVAFAQSEPSLVHEGRFWVRTLTGSAPVADASRLHVITEGNVVFRGDSAPTVTYTVKARVRASSQREAENLLRGLEAKIKNAGDMLTVAFAVPREANSGAELSMTVPRTLRESWIETRGGNLQATDLDGEFRAESAGGAIHIDRINAAANVRTAGGDVVIGRINGPVRCYSGGGAIHADSVEGESWFETAGGDISIREARIVHASTGGGNIRVERSSGAVFARTGGGLIEVQQSAGAVTAETSGGAIQVNAAQGVKCESAGGAIRLRNVAGSLRANTNSGSILAELLSGNHIEDSTLSTNSGDITVFISSKIPLTIHARNDSGGSTGRIISDFPEIRVKPVAPGIVPVVAEGTLNGGGPLLRIAVTGGTIYLRRDK